MRNLLVLIFAVTILSACSKSGGSSTSSAAFLACAYNGIMDTFPVSSITSEIQLTIKAYYLQAQDAKNNDVTLYMAISTLSIGTYTQTSGSEAYYNGVNYFVSNGASNSTITITSLHNGLADGTFSASMLDRTNKIPLYITKGVFRNVPVAP